MLLGFQNLQSLLQIFWNLKSLNMLLVAVTRQANRSQGKKPTYSVISLMWTTKHNSSSRLLCELLHQEARSNC